MVSLKEILLIVGVFIGYIVMMTVLLPKLGVHT